MNQKKIKLPYGIPGHNLGEIEREIPASEPPAWPVNDKLKHVGKRVKRYDAVAKVTGKAKFTADIQLPGMLYAKFFNSKTPHANIKSINTKKAENLPGVYAVHLLKDDNGNYPVVKYAGQPLGAVAASSLAIAEEAAKIIEVEYEKLNFVIDLEDAQHPEAPLVHQKTIEAKEDAGDVGVTHDASKASGNVVGPSTNSFYGGPRGNLEEGFKEADVILEKVYRTQVQTHVPLETHGVVIDWKPGNMTVYEVHGHMRKATCTHCFRVYEGDDISEDVMQEGNVPRCEDCGGVIKPNVILFGEQLPIRILQAAQRAAKDCDVMLVVGSSLEVMPASNLAVLAKRHGAKVVIINLDETALDSVADVVLRGDAAEILPAVVHCLETLSL